MTSEQLLMMACCLQEQQEAWSHKQERVHGERETNREDSSCQVWGSEGRGRMGVEGWWWAGQPVMDSRYTARQRTTTMQGLKSQNKHGIMRKDANLIKDVYCSDLFGFSVC